MESICTGSKPGPSQVMDLDKELTKKFLSGEITFADYSNEWYSYEGDDEIEDEIPAKNDELRSTKSVQLMEKGLPKRRKLTRLSAALMGLMGEANLRFARGEKDVAEKMCHEIIKQVPTAPEPYQTLAQIFEDDVEKSLQFSLLAAHLSPPDANEWLRLAAISKQRNDARQEMICYTQAIKAEPHNLDLHLKRLELLSVFEEKKCSLNLPTNLNRVKCYHKIVTSLPASNSDTILKYARMAVSLYHNNQEIERALEVMAAAYKKCSDKFNMSDINIFLELLMARKQFETCLEVFVANVGIEIEAEIMTVKKSDGTIEEDTNYLQCTIPNNIPIDLRSKLLICFVYLGAFNLVQTLLNDFLTNDVEKAGDLYMDVEEALSSVGQHELAMRLLEPLIKHSSFDLGAVWLKHAECLYHLGKDDDAIASYYKVLQHAPQHPDPRRKLFSILEKKGRIDEALQILQQDYKYVVSAALLQEQCNILKKYNRMLEYLDAGEALLSKTFMKFKHEEELKIACKIKGSLEYIQNFRAVRGESIYNEDDIHFDEEEAFKLTPDEEYNFFKELLRLSLEYKQYYRMQRLAFGALLSKSLSSHRQDIEFYCLQASYLTNDYFSAFRFIKEFIPKFPTLLTWNLFNLIMNHVEENVNIKFLTRLFNREDKYNTVRDLFLGNNFISSGRYLVALKYYLDYHNNKKEPLTALIIGVTILVMAAQRTVSKHHNLILQGICYLLTYESLRKCDQESYYNLGRAYQMLNINNLAIEYYERALNCGPVTECPNHGEISLTRETAYNLYLLYKDHSPNMARKYMLTYLVI